MMLEDLHEFCTLVGACVIFTAGVMTVLRILEWILRLTGFHRWIQERRTRRRALALLLEDVSRRHHLLTRR